MEILAIVLAAVGSGLMGFGFAALALGESPVRLRRDDFPVIIVVRNVSADLPDRGAPTQEGEVA